MNAESDPGVGLPGNKARDRIFRAFNAAAVDVIAYAEGLRLATKHDAVHMGQLLVGLANEPGGEAARLLAKVRYPAEHLGALFWGSMPEPGAVSRPKLDALPNLSENAWDAISVASRTARAHGSPDITPRHLLFGALSIEKSDAIQRLNAIGLKKEDVAIGVPDELFVGQANDDDGDSAFAWRSERPGVASDIVAGQKDLLGLEREVEVLCSVVAARDVEPPVSIGLFGDWGTGKTFFMKQMEAWIDEMKKQARKAPAAASAYCTNIVQLWFNAWHYIDANLWASLTASIFEGLGNALREDKDLMQGVEDREKARARLMSEAASARDILAAAEKKKTDAEADQQALQQSLDSLRVSESAIARSLVSAAVDVARAQPEVKQQLEEAGKMLGVPALEASTKKLQSQVHEIFGVAGTLRALGMAVRQIGWKTLGAIIVAAMVGAAAWWWVSKSSLSSSIDKVVMQLGALATSLGAFVAQYLPRVLRAKKLVDDTLKKHEETLAADEARRRAELERQKAEVRQQMEAAEKRLEEARAVVGDLDKKLAALRADTRMSEFVAARRESTDYTQHLGVVARARRDFERLSDLLQQVKREGASKDGVPLPRIDRIVLYIDDLDRCPEDKVFDVLQAVHLLLAFPLFVVVVGVDSRWLLRSLKQRTGIFREADDAGDGMSSEERIHWQSTPLNYLEKIFQIPFALRPMERGGFERLIQNLAPTAEAAPVAGIAKAPPQTSLVDVDRAVVERPAVPIKTVAGAPVAAPAPPSRPDIAPPAQASVAPEVAAPPAGAGTTGEGSSALDARPIDLNPGHLKISAAEQELMKQLFPFMPSPRAVKRFVNVYRLLRATVEREDWDAFLSEDGDGHFRAVMLLLAILTGYPSEATEILRDLVEEPPSSSWWDAVAKYHRPRAGWQDGRVLPLPADAAIAAQAERMRWTELLTKLEEMRKLGIVGRDVPCSVFTSWARRVARYSFESGRIQAARAAAPAPAPEKRVEAAAREAAAKRA